MHTENSPTTLRRSSRVPTSSLPILVTTLEGTHFSEVCETLVVSAHGCAILSPVKLNSGIPLRFHSKKGRETTAQVVSCQPIGTDKRTWKLGAKLDQPENFWDLTDYPKDWVIPVSAKFRNITPPTSNVNSNNVPPPVSPSQEERLESVLSRLQAPIRRMIAESVLPVQTQVAALQETITRRDANRSRFEVSLSSIPAELQSQLESRLKNDLGPRVLDESRQQYANVLAQAKATIDQKLKEAHEEYVRRATEELKNIQKRGQGISEHLAQNAQEQVRGALHAFQQKLLDGGNSLKRLSEELLQYLQHTLNEQHDALCAELEQARVAVSSESSRLHKEVESLQIRIAKLHESARSLESGLDKRLSQMSSNTVKDMRGQLESLANAVLDDVTTRTTKNIEAQMEKASGNMIIVQKGVIASASETLATQAANALHNYERSTEELAKRSAERLRVQLASGLNAVSKTLEEQFRWSTRSGDLDKE